jgi:ATP-binding cassette subfamily B protein
VYSAVNKLFDVLPEVLIGMAVDVVVNQKASFLARFGVQDPTHQLVLLAVLTIFIWVFESLFEYLYALRWRNLAQNLQHDLRMEAYAHVQRLELAWFESRRTGKPAAFIETDLVDPRYFSAANVKNRLESYFQMIKQKRTYGHAAPAGPSGAPIIPIAAH